MVGQKLSDYQVEKILRAFAYGEQASAVVEAERGRKGSRAPNTVFQIYELIRSRLLEIGYFPEPAEYWRQMNTGDARYQFPWSDTAKRILDQEDRLRGTSQETARLHLAEIIFRAENPNLTPEALYIEIRNALRTTGPLNRPPRDRDIWFERHRINLYRRQVDELRSQKRPEIYGTILARHETMLTEAETRLRKLLRDRRKAEG